MGTRGIKSVRSFGKPENRKIGNFLIVACTVLSLCILSLVKSHYCPAPNVKSEASLQLQRSEKAVVKLVIDESRDDSSFRDDEDDEEGSKHKTNKTEPVCYQSSRRSDTCEAKGDIRVQSTSKTIFISNPSTPQEWKIKPYPRKNEPGALIHVREWLLKPFPQNLPPCTKNHSAPAIIFSIGGFTGNVFHDFTDVLIPLFITCRKFKGEVHFLTSDTKNWWVGRYLSILKQLTHHEIIDMEMNKEAATILCYPEIIVGPIFQNELGVDSTKPTNQSMSEFKALVRNAFGLSRTNATGGTSNSRPRLLIISRKKSRAFVNENAIVAMATSLGFDVRVGEPDMNTDVAKFARLVNSADVLMGVHGAGLTNMVYLPSGAVVIQVIPLGGLEWLARESFKEPAFDMGVKYLEYKIKEEESTLIEEYPRDHEVIKDPYAVHKKGWNALKEVYLDKQNVRPHLGRLRNTLLEASKFLHHNS